MLARIQINAAPLLLPLAPATFLGWQVYDLLVSLNQIIAIVVAVATAAGLEFIGGAACHAAMQSYQRREWWPFGFAVGVVGAYVVSAMATVFSLETGQARFLAYMFLLTPLAYGAYAIVNGFEQATKDEHGQVQDELELLRARRLLVNSETRKIKSGSLPAATAKLPESAGDLPEWLPELPADRRQWRQMEIDLPAGVTSAELAAIPGWPVGERASRDWLGDKRDLRTLHNGQ